MLKKDENLLGASLTSWVLDKVEEWEQHYVSNYQEKHLEYDRLWRGIWAENDKTRGSERSKLISPASAQAVESSVAEVEEAIFGRGEFIDIRDDLMDQDKNDITLMRAALMEDFEKRGLRKVCGEVLVNAAVTGTGIMELVLNEVEEKAPATQPLDQYTNAVGVESRDKIVVDYRAIHPRNFRIDPAACSVEGAMGVAIDEYVPTHQVELLQESGIYRDDVMVGVSYTETTLEADQNLVAQAHSKCRLIKYYGLVPTELLDADKDPEGDDPFDGYDIEMPEVERTYYTEAIVVIDATSGELLKAEKNPFMMGQRPVVTFQWDTMPGVFYGRGVIEKGYNSQKAIDCELRARADALALTAHPMIAVDGTRMPRGMNAKVIPGKTLITTGDPNQILRPFKFGEVSGITFNQAEALERMHQRATGAIDTAGLPQEIGDARSGAVSMALGGVIKRHKRTLMAFQNDFLIPAVEMAAWLYIQYDPERFPAKDYKFVVSGSMGIMAREFETSQLTQLLATTGKESPAYLPLIEAIINNMHLNNRDQLIATIQQAAQPSPEQQQAQQRQAQLQEQLLQAQIAAFQAQANESNKRAEKYEAEKRAIPIELENDRINAISKQLALGSEDDKEFSRRFKEAELQLSQRKMQLDILDSAAKHGINPTETPQAPQREVNNDPSSQERGFTANSQPDQRPF